MKTLTLAFFAFCIATLCRAANPSLENFDQLYFKTNAPAPGIIQTRMNTNQFRSPVLPGDTWTITNVTGLTGASHWTNVAGVLQPVDGSSVLVTNLTATSNTVNVGTMTWLSKSIVLTNGVNYLPSGKYSQLQLISPSTDPSLVQIVLSNGWNTVQHLEIFNLTNAVPSQGAFTLTNLTPIPDSLGGGVVKLINSENWVATNGCGIELRFISPDWVEQFRSDVSGNPTFISNTFNNITVISNTTLRGRITINNINVTTNTLWTTNIVGGVTNLQPVDLTLPVFITNRIAFGPGDTNWLHRTGQQLIYEADSAEFLVHGTDNSNYTGVHSDNSVGWLTTTAPVLELKNSTKTLAFYGDNIQVLSTPQIDIGQDYAPWGNLYLTGRILGTNGVKTNYLFSPSVADGVTPYRMDTDVTHTSGNLLEWSNNSTNRVSSDWMGRLAISQGDSSSAPTMIPGLQWRGDNGAVIGGSGLMRDQTGAFGVIEGSKEILHDTLGALFVSTNTLFGWSVDPGFYTANVTMGLTNVTGTGGSTYTGDIVFTKPGSYLARINYNSGYDGTGNLFLSSDGTYKAAGGSTPVGTLVNTNGSTTDGYIATMSGTTGTNTAPKAPWNVNTNLTVLTPADAGVSLDFNASQYASITLTGKVTFTSANLAAVRKLRLHISNPQATNCAYVWPWPSTNWLGAASPGSIAAGKQAEMEVTSWGTTTNAVLATYAEQP